MFLLNIFKNIYEHLQGYFLKPFILVVWKLEAINAIRWMPIGYQKKFIFCNLKISGSFLIINCM